MNHENGNNEQKIIFLQQIVIINKDRFLPINDTETEIHVDSTHFDTAKMCNK